MGSNLAFHTELDFYVVNCGCCGGVYAILERVRLQKEREGKSWTCPYCATGWGYQGNGTNAELKRQLKQAERDLQSQKKRTEWAKEEARHAESRRRGEKAAKTRIQNRIANGVCPCCQRSFKNLHRHMQNKHPDYSSVLDRPTPVLGRQDPD